MKDKEKPAKKEAQKKGNRGGRREGAGRKKGVQLKENPRNKYATFTVSEKTLNKIRQLRELTKDDEIGFNLMFIRWVDEYAKDYGIE